MAHDMLPLLYRSATAVVVMTVDDFIILLLSPTESVQRLESSALLLHLVRVFVCQLTFSSSSFSSSFAIIILPSSVFIFGQLEPLDAAVKQSPSVGELDRKPDDGNNDVKEETSQKS